MADDGSDTSPRYSDWTIFRVNTMENPGSNCPVRILNELTAEAAATTLDHLVDEQPHEYADSDYDAASGAIMITAVRNPGASDSVVATAALAEAQASINASSELTVEEKLESAAALSARVVDFSQADLSGVMADMATRQDNGDLALSDVVATSLDTELNRVLVATSMPSPELELDLRERYGDRVLMEMVEPVDAAASPFGDGQTYPYAGLAIGVDRPGDNLGMFKCTASIPVNGKSYGYPYTALLTAGHCGPSNSVVSQVTCGGASDIVSVRPAGTIRASEYTEYRDAAAIVGNYNVPVMYTGEGSGACTTPIVAGNRSRTIGSISTATPNKGSKMCKWGTSSGFHCGYTLSKQLTQVRYKNNGGKHRNLVAVSGYSSQEPAVIPGDSGGPVFTIIQQGPLAGRVHILGVLVGGGSERMLYYPIREVMNWLGVTPIVGAPPR